MFRRLLFCAVLFFPVLCGAAESGIPAINLQLEAASGVAGAPPVAAQSAIPQPPRPIEPTLAPETQTETADTEPGLVMQWYETAKQNFYPILAVTLCIWFWNRFMRMRCPDCGAPHPRLFKVEECDSWMTPKRINEKRDLSARPRKTSFTKVSRTYICPECHKQWSVVSDK